MLGLTFELMIARCPGPYCTRRSSEHMIEHKQEVSHAMGVLQDIFWPDEK